MMRLLESVAASVDNKRGAQIEGVRLQPGAIPERLMQLTIDAEEVIG